MTNEQNERLTYEEHERAWQREHKAYLPKKKVVSANSLVGGLLLWFIILAATMVLSGAHSVPTVAETIPTGDIVTDEIRNAVAMLGFVMLELTIFASAMYRTKSVYAKLALGLSLIGGVIANENSAVSQVMTAADPNILKLIVAIVVGLAAPLTAYFSGEMVGNLFSEYAGAQRMAEVVYDEEKKKMNDKINAAWTRYLKQFETDSVALEVVDEPEEVSKEKPKNYPPAAIELAERILEDNNEAMTISQIMEHYAVKSRGTAASARKIVKEYTS